MAKRRGVQRRDVDESLDSVMAQVARDHWKTGPRADFCAVCDEQGARVTMLAGGRVENSAVGFYQVPICNECLDRLTNQGRVYRPASVAAAIIVRRRKGAD